MVRLTLISLQPITVGLFVVDEMVNAGSRQFALAVRLMACKRPQGVRSYNPYTLWNTSMNVVLDLHELKFEWSSTGVKSALDLPTRHILAYNFYPPL